MDSPAPSSGRGDPSRPQAFNKASGTNLERQLRSAQARSCGEETYWLGSSLSLWAVFSKSLREAGAAPALPQFGFPRCLAMLECNLKPGIQPGFGSHAV